MSDRNVVVLVLDTVRADVFDAEGSELESTATYTHPWTFAPAHYTTPSHASMLTGQLPSAHGVHSGAPRFESLGERDDLLTETLASAHDAHSLAVCANGGFLSSQYGFDTLFDDHTAFDGNTMRYPDGLNLNAFLSTTDADPPWSYLAYLREALDSDAPHKSLLNGLFAKANDVTRGTSLPRVGDYGAEPACRTARDRITGAESEAPVFGLINLIDAHGPFTVPKDWPVDDVDASWGSRGVSAWDISTSEVDEYTDYLDNWEAMYRAAVRYLDRRVSEFVSTLLSATSRETTVIVTADHGEEFPSDGVGRGTLGHKDLTAPVAHVPFAVINPPGEARDWETQLPDVLSLLDLPTIVAAVMDDQVPEIDRRVAPAEKLGHPKTPDDLADARYYDRTVRLAVRDDRTAIRWDSLGAVDRLEVHESAEQVVGSPASIPEWVTEQFPRAIADVAEDSTGAAEVDAAVTSQLEELGYL